MESAPRKVCVVVTARPSYARIKSVMEAVRDHPDLELQLVVAASALLERYGPVVDVIRADGFEPDAVVYMVVEGENLVTTAKSTGHGVVELATLFDNLEPDVVVSVADRYETLATAIAAAYQNIPVAHVQGGEVTGSIDEKVRHAVTKLADLHFVANEGARERVVRMGEDPDRVHVTGCPSVDLAARVAAAREEEGAFDPFARYGGVGDPFDPAGDYMVVMQHPVTTEYEDALHQVNETLEAVKALDVPTFWFWPNVDAGSDRISKGIRVFRETRDIPHVYFFKNLAPEDFLRLLMGARCLVGNSSVGIREGSYLGVPVVNVGGRQAGRDRAANVPTCPTTGRPSRRPCGPTWPTAATPRTTCTATAGPAGVSPGCWPRRRSRWRSGSRTDAGWIVDRRIFPWRRPRSSLSVGPGFQRRLFDGGDMSEDEYQKLVEFVAGRFDKVDGRLSGVEGELKGVKGRLTGVETRLTRVEVRVEGNEVQIQTLSEGLTTLRADMLRRFDTVDGEFVAVRREMAAGFASVDHRFAVLESDRASGGRP